jgi:hypothetical protein
MGSYVNPGSFLDEAHHMSIGQGLQVVSVQYGDRFNVGQLHFGLLFHFKVRN